MFAIAKYKAVKEFDYQDNADRHYGLGMELVVEDAIGEQLVKEGKVEMVKYLDPNDTADQADIEKFSIKDENEQEESFEEAGLSTATRRRAKKSADEDAA